MNRSWMAMGGAAAVLLATACDDDPKRAGNGGPPPPPPDYTYDVVEAFPNLTFVRPVDIQNAGDGTDRLFVVEQNGFIRVFDNDPGVASSSQFLAVSVTCCSELGLLGLAFHPQYESNGFFFVYYTVTTTSLMSRLSRFSVSGNPNVADPASEKILLEFPQDYSNHNGGGLCFDGDGYLCLAVGDEGGGGDPDENAQNRAVVYGKILRFDVNQNVNTIPYYGIPPDNPYAGNGSGYREEIYAYGLRNPWRISYDAATDRLWAGDVGQGAREEVDIIVSGGNYGWDCREGFIAYTGPPDAPGPLCASASGLLDPVWDYPRSEGYSVTGGYVYRGPTLTSLVGQYVYADYGTGRVWALTYGPPATNQLLEAAGMAISTFGVAENGELFIAGYQSNGTPTALYRIEQTEVTP
jgi:glucose/arabinose dehydrogenase